jgi:hypothetical protein
MDMLSRWLVQQPVHILAIALAHLALWALCRMTILRGAPRANIFWVPALLWLAYAAWEWLVLTKSPDANIRIDLLLLWPLLGIAMLWALVRAVRGWWLIPRR